MGISRSAKSQMNAQGVAPVFGCRAWVNFNGTAGGTIRGSGNVSSITDNGAGDYTVNFQNQMPNANYSAIGSCRRGSPATDTNATFSFPLAGIYSVSAVQIRTQAYNNWAQLDADIVNLAIFG